MSMILRSTAFTTGQAIPVRHTGEGEDVSPDLEWEGTPQSTRSLALICDDPDAPTADPWVHWLIYNIPATTLSLPGSIPRDGELNAPITATQGRNSWPEGKNLGYLGPMPPRGHGIHHYHFRLYALSISAPLPVGLTKPQLLDAIADHVVATAEIVGLYERK